MASGSLGKQQVPAKGPSQKALEKATEQQQAQQAVAGLAGVDPDIATAASSIQQNQRDVFIGSQMQAFLDGLKPQAAFSPPTNGFLSERAMERFVASPDRVREWQNKLGQFQRVLGRNPYYVPGQLDPNTRADTAQVFAYLYDTGGVDPWKMLDDMTKAAVANDLGGSKTRQVPTFTPSSDAEIQIGVHRAYLNTVGRMPNNKELQAFVDSYHEMERNRYERQVTAEETPESRTTVPQLPSAEQQALTGLEGTPEAMGYRARGFAQTLASLIGRQ